MAFLRSKMDKTLFPVNDRNVNAMTLEIYVLVSKRSFFVTYIVTFNPIYARWGQKKAFLR